jgi:hypothetical protein
MNTPKPDSGPSPKPLAALVRNTHSHKRETNRDRAYTSSYRTMRLVVGFLGVTLPIALIIGEAGFLKGGVHVRGSLSAYYHTSMRDIFVGGLCVIGFLLATYLAGEWRTADFWVSLVGGIAVLGVVFFPKMRSGLAPEAPRCGADPTPAGCSFVQQALGESRTALIHGIFAVIFILALATMSGLFALSEVRLANGRMSGIRGRKSRVMFVVYATSAAVILIAGVYAFFGFGIWELTRLYIGEVTSVVAFGVSWILASLPISAPSREPTTAGEDVSSSKERDAVQPDTSSGLQSAG